MKLIKYNKHWFNPPFRRRLGRKRNNNKWKVLEPKLKIRLFKRHNRFRKKIALFRDGIDDERFRSLRLARGVYGQRQEGVQMIRIKLPFGKVTSEQLVRITKVSDEYSTGRLHNNTSGYPNSLCEFR
jgi:dissimilatory sulfite reductase (desulfoviridin) alpha/beta subunit